MGEVEPMDSRTPQRAQPFIDIGVELYIGAKDRKSEKEPGRIGKAQGRGVSANIKMRIIELLIEAIGWLKIAASPLLGSVIVGGVVYYYKQDAAGLATGIIIAAIGLIAGIIWATRIWKKQGTNDFLSKIMSPELEYSHNNKYEAGKAGVDFIAILHYKKTEEGGRKTPARSGYRPLLKFNFSEMQTSAQQVFINRELVFPGDVVEAEIKIIAVDHFAGCLIEGMEFEFGEGRSCMGTGKIKHVINSKLRKSPNS
jgi:hypothetical protein